MAAASSFALSTAAAQANVGRELLLVALTALSAAGITEGAPGGGAPATATPATRREEACPEAAAAAAAALVGDALPGKDKDAPPPADQEEDGASTEATLLSPTGANISRLSQSGSSYTSGGSASVEVGFSVSTAAGSAGSLTSSAAAVTEVSVACRGEAAAHGGDADAAVVDIAAQLLDQAAIVGHAPEVPDLEAELSALAASNKNGNRAYLERLARAAAESAAKGYSARRQTHVLRRTRVHKTTKVTDLRTMSTQRRTEEYTKVERWVEDGAAPITGVSVVCARGRRCTERYTDGGERVVEQSVRGQAMFWLGGNDSSMQPTSTFDFEKTTGGVGTSAACPRPTALTC